MWEPEAYFIDIDRTLVKGHNDKKMNIDDIFAIKTIAKKGVYIILSTGRSYKDIKNIWKQIEVNTKYTSYVIANNGAAIWNIKKNINLFESLIDEKDFNAIIKFVEDNNYAIKNSGQNEFFSNSKILTFLIRKLGKGSNIENNFNLIEYNKDTAKKLGIISSFRKKKVKRIIAKLKSTFPNLEILVSGTGRYIEINKKNVSKGEAAKFLSKELDFNIKQTVHIGDSMNDLSAFKVCGKGVAMGNAMKDLKKEATYFTKKVSKAGVANTIRSFTK